MRSLALQQGGSAAKRSLSGDHEIRCVSDASRSSKAVLSFWSIAAAFSYMPAHGSPVSI